MILYHGSRTDGIEVLEPRQADHDRPYIYMSTLEVVAAFYLCNAVERPYYWFPYGFCKSDRNIPYYDEMYPNALEEVSRGVSGFIYKVEASEDQVILFKNIHCVRLGTKPIPVVGSVYIPDAWELFQHYLEIGVMKVYRYEDKSSAYHEADRKLILNSIMDKDIYKTPNCSLAKFILTKFPDIWQEYMEIKESAR